MITITGRRRAARRQALRSASNAKRAELLLRTALAHRARMERAGATR